MLDLLKVTAHASIIAYGHDLIFYARVIAVFLAAIFSAQLSMFLIYSFNVLFFYSIVIIDNPVSNWGAAVIIGHAVVFAIGLRMVALARHSYEQVKKLEDSTLINNEDIDESEIL
jgi:hypothetical protein